TFSKQIRYCHFVTIIKIILSLHLLITTQARILTIEVSVNMEKIIDENKQGESLILEPKTENTRKLYIESYGCSMNFSDSEIVASILANEGYNTTDNLEDADLVLVNTCSIRDKAEQTIRK